MSSINHDIAIIITSVVFIASILFFIQPSLVSAVSIEATSADGDPDQPIITGTVPNTESTQNNETSLEFVTNRAQSSPSEVGGDSEDIGAPSADTSTSFSVEREMKESGEKAGTEDINIGVGELEKPPTSSRSGFMKLGDIKGESSDSSKKGNIEYTWKVEERGKAEKPKEIVVVGSKNTDKSSPKLTLANCDGTHFVCEPSDVETEDDLLEYAERHVNEGSVRKIKFDDSRLSVEYSQPVSLFGFIKINMKETTSVNLGEDEFGRVKVKFPWWHVLTKKTNSINDSEERVREAISNLDMKWDNVDNKSGLDILVLSTTSESDDRPTEEVAFYFNKIKASFLNTIISTIND
jgi:type VI protein secretion system component Hcp